MAAAPEQKPAAAPVTPVGLSDREIRLRLIEAAARTPMVHKDGHAKGVMEVAEQWLAFVKGGTLGVPPKAV